MAPPAYAVAAPIFRRYIPISIVIILTLIQGLLIVGCEFMAYNVYDCKPDNINLGMILFFKYFGGAKCNNPSQSPLSGTGQNLEMLNVDQGSSISIDKFNTHLPTTITVAQRVYIEIIAYGAINILWIVTSVLALGGCFCKVVGRVPFFILFAPWFLVVVVGSLLDLVATIFHIIDITNTRSLSSVLDYLQVSNSESLQKFTNYSKDFLSIPIIAVCITSKLVILWLVNLFGSFMALTQMKKIAYDRKPSTLFTDYNSNKSEQQNDQMSVKDDIVKPNNRNQYANYQLETNSGSIRNSIGQDNSPAHAQSAILRRITQNYGRQPSEENNYQIREGSPNRMSSGSGTSQGQSPSKDKVHLTGELRKELPWTYLNFGKDLGKAMKALHPHEEHDVSPPVPVPDYEMDHPAPANHRIMHRPSSAHRS